MSIYDSTQDKTKHLAELVTHQPDLTPAETDRVKFLTLAIATNNRVTSRLLNQGKHNEAGQVHLQAENIVDEMITIYEKAVVRAKGLPVDGR